MTENSCEIYSIQPLQKELIITRLHSILNIDGYWEEMKIINLGTAIIRNNLEKLFFIKLN
jgi:hypothetical protein